MTQTFSLDGRKLHQSAALVVVALLICFSWSLGTQAGIGRTLAFSLLAGAVFGLLLQRSRFCFFCITRDFIDRRDSRGLLGLVLALMVGTLGYHAIFGAILPVPGAGRLPPDAHIGPVSWVLALAALVFGAGMSISGSCISAHLYRLGEGSLASVLALLGALVGFGLGFLTWNSLYLNSLQAAPVVWLPHHLGYGGSLLLQLGLLSVVAVVLMRAHQASEEAPATTGFWQAIVEQRWPTYVGGLAIGFLGTVAYFRVAPLGVTAELGSIARTTGTYLQLLPERLEGLDSYAGCATAIKETLLSNNGVFILGLVFASFAGALFCGNFKLTLPSLSDAARTFGGGVLMGWGAMTALGCTVGTLLSGIMAAALSGWVFAVFCLLGLWLTWLLRKRLA
jgi:hypothetical protein